MDSRKEKKTVFPLAVSASISVMASLGSTSLAKDSSFESESTNSSFESEAKDSSFESFESEREARRRAQDEKDRQLEEIIKAMQVQTAKTAHSIKV